MEPQLSVTRSRTPSCCGALRTQKLRSSPPTTQSYERFCPLKSGVGQNVASARNNTALIPLHTSLHFFQIFSRLPSPLFALSTLFLPSAPPASSTFCLRSVRLRRFLVWTLHVVTLLLVTLLVVILIVTLLCLSSPCLLSPCFVCHPALIVTRLVVTLPIVTRLGRTLGFV